MPVVALTRLPFAPVMAEALVPPLTVRVVALRLMVPPVKDVIVEVAPLRLTVPPETAVEVRAPVTVTVPSAIPPVIVAAEPKVVLPAPASE